MHTFLDSKAMAKALRTALAERKIDVTHSDSLELVARQFGLKDWNTLSAQIDAATSKLVPLPRGWFRTGSGDPALYWMGPDAQEGHLHIASLVDAAILGDRFGSLGQSILSDDYRGQMIRLTAELKGIGCDAATIWMRIDSAVEGKWLRFDNLIDRAGVGPLSGTFDWTRREIVLDVPDDAESIVFGVLLKGTGKVWARGIDLDIAPAGARRTDYPRRASGFGFGEAA